MYATGDVVGKGAGRPSIDDKADSTSCMYQPDPQGDPKLLTL